MPRSVVAVLVLLAGCQTPWFGQGARGAEPADGTRIGAVAAHRPPESPSTEVTAAYDAEGYSEEELDEEDTGTSAENQKLLAQLKAKGVDVRNSNRGVVINLPDVLFEFAKAGLTPRAADTIHEISDIVLDAESRQLSIEGHADSIGTIEHNYRLSEARAQSVVRELEKNGIPSRRLSLKALGETDPISSNRTEEGRTKNRRVEIVILNPS